MARACAKFTLTAAWLSPPWACLRDRLIVTGIVEPEPPELLPAPELPEPLPVSELPELCATELTALTLPPTVSPAGISTVTRAPTFASDCLLGSRSTVTICRVEVVSRIGDADPPPLSVDGFAPFEDGLAVCEGLPLFEDCGRPPFEGLPDGDRCAAFSSPISACRSTISASRDFMRCLAAGL